MITPEDSLFSLLILLPIYPLIAPDTGISWNMGAYDWKWDSKNPLPRPLIALFMPSSIMFWKSTPLDKSLSIFPI